MSYLFPALAFATIAAKSVRVRFTVELSLGTNSGNEDNAGVKSSAFQTYYDNNFLGVGITQKQAFFTYDTSIIPAGATITAAIFRYRTGTILIGGGAPAAQVNRSGKATAGMGYATGTFMNGPVAVNSGTAYSYTLAAADYALIAKGAGARTCMIVEDATVGVAGDNVTVPYIQNSCELEVAWTQ